MPRSRYAESEIPYREDDRYDDRRSRRGGRERDDRYYEEEIDYRRGPPVREREREREVSRDVLVREREDVRYRDETPAFLRDDYGRTSAGPLVLRKRETEDFDYAPRPRRRSLSPESEAPPRREQEEVIIRRRSPSPEPPPLRRERERDVDREEIIIRRQRSPSPERGPPRRDREREREGIIIKSDDRDRRGPRIDDYDQEEVIIRRRTEDERPPRAPNPPRDYDREEIVIRRGEQDSDDRSSRYTRGRDDYALAPRPISHERHRSRSRRDDREDEIVIRRDDRDGGRGGDRSREEIIIRKREESRSPSPVASSRPLPRQELEPIYAPPIHREIIEHVRRIDHGYENALVPRAPSRPPSPPMPPPARERSEERIEIRRRGERNGKAYDEDIIIDRNADARSTAPERGPYRGRGDEIDIREERGPPGYRGRDEDRGHRDRDIEEEADYYNSRAVDRSFVGEGHNGTVRDWAIVDVPPGTRRVRMDGAGGGSQEITWQRYNGVRRSKFLPDGERSASDEGYGSEVGRPIAGGGGVAARYGQPRREGDGLWTEITKDLVLKDAMMELGYEYEETADFYYVMAYLKYVSSRASPTSYPYTTPANNRIGRRRPPGRHLGRHQREAPAPHPRDGVGGARRAAAGRHRRAAKEVGNRARARGRYCGRAAREEEGQRAVVQRAGSVC